MGVINSQLRDWQRLVGRRTGRDWGRMTETGEDTDGDCGRKWQRLGKEKAETGEGSDGDWGRK